MKIGRYDIESVIGRGAMGLVYLAYDPQVCRHVAVKTVHLPQDDPAVPVELAERLLREARAAGNLSHAGIVTIYDVGRDLETESHFIVMEYVQGRSLDRLIAVEAPLPVKEVVEYARQLTEALHAAHGAGLVHRDIKPPNILVREPDGIVKIGDFGVARLPNSNLTRDETIGSPGYMAPEQFRGGVVDRRADLFSLGIILYEMLCGRRPFEGRDFAALSYSIVHEPHTPLTEHRSDLPARVGKFFDRALAKDPAERFPTALALRNAFEECLDPTGSRTRIGPGEVDPEQRSGGGDRPVRGPLVAGVMLLAFALVLLWVLRAHRDGALAAPAPEIGDAEATAPALPAAERQAPGDRGPAPLSEEPAPVPPPLEPALLAVRFRSSVKSGSLSLFIDDVEAFDCELYTEERGARRFFKKIAGKVHEEFDREIEVEPGTHEIRARVWLDAKGKSFEDTLSVAIEPGETRVLQVTAGSRKRVSIRLIDG